VPTALDGGIRSPRKLLRAVVSRLRGESSSARGDSEPVGITQKPTLTAELEALDSRRRAAFAASCCERVLPAYEAFSREEKWGDPEPLRVAVARVWASVLGTPLEVAEAEELSRLCEHQVHHLDEPFGSLFTAPAQDAAIAVVGTVECAVNGAVATAAGVAEHALEAFEAYVDATEGEGSIFDQELIDSSPVYQAELGSQRKDLSLLNKSSEIDEELVEHLRERSRTTGFAMLVRR
jgi:uncharacterized protein